MALPYSLIFQDSGGVVDSAKNACGLSAAFMRFLFSVTDYPHTFYNGDDKVALTDTERQLIESGIATLTTLADEVCGMKHIFSAYLPNQVTGVTNTETNLPMTAVHTDSSYVVWFDGVNLELAPGNYLYHLSVRLGSLPVGTEFINRIRIREVPSGNMHRASEFYGQYGLTSHHMTFVFRNPPIIYPSWEQLSGVDRLMWYGSTNTRLEVVRVG